MGRDSIDNNLLPGFRPTGPLTLTAKLYLSSIASFKLSLTPLDWSNRMQHPAELPAPKNDSCNPSRSPSKTLESGAKMLAIEMGTFGSDHISTETVAEAVRYAGIIGYRHFDCAWAYGTEFQIGPVFLSNWRWCQKRMHRE